MTALGKLELFWKVQWSLC